MHWEPRGPGPVVQEPHLDWERRAVPAHTYAPALVKTARQTHSANAPQYTRMVFHVAGAVMPSGRLLQQREQGRAPQPLCPKPLLQQSKPQPGPANGALPPPTPTSLHPYPPPPVVSAHMWHTASRPPLVWGRGGATAAGAAFSELPLQPRACFHQAPPNCDGLALGRRWGWRKR
jgi:hypothetical protein